MKKKPSLASLRKKAWKTFSLFVRQSHKDHREMVNCVTCGREHHWKEVHAGHFIHISKQHPLSYDERNVHPQCVQCNYYGAKGMASIHYTQFMIKTYGDDIVDTLEKRKREAYLKRDELERLVEAYRWFSDKEIYFPQNFTYTE